MHLFDNIKKMHTCARYKIQIVLGWQYFATVNAFWLIYGKDSNYRKSIHNLNWSNTKKTAYTNIILKQQTSVRIIMLCNFSAVLSIHRSYYRKATHKLYRSNTAKTVNICIVFRHQNYIKSIIFCQFNAVWSVHQSYYQKPIHKLYRSHAAKIVRIYVTLKTFTAGRQHCFTNVFMTNF